MAAVREQIITEAKDLDAFCADLAQQPAFGFDTEFVGEDTYHPLLCLVQVASPDCLTLLDPLVNNMSLEPFWRLVTESSRTAVVHAGREEVRICRSAMAPSSARSSASACPRARRSPNGAAVR
jgi:ribonuclease D